MSNVTNPMKGTAMTKVRIAPSGAEMKALLLSDEDGFRALLQCVVQEVLEAEMSEALNAEKGERTSARQGYRSGYYDRKLVTRVGVLELRVPQDRAGQFSTALFERYQRSEKALVSTLAEMYVQGVSTRKVKAITEELCGHSFSASTISQPSTSRSTRPTSGTSAWTSTRTPEARNDSRRWDSFPDSARPSIRLPSWRWRREMDSCSATTSTIVINCSFNALSTDAISSSGNASRANCRSASRIETRHSESEAGGGAGLTSQTRRSPSASGGRRLAVWRVAMTRSGAESSTQIP